MDVRIKYAVIVYLQEHLFDVVKSRRGINLLDTSPVSTDHFSLEARTFSVKQPVVVHNVDHQYD